MNTEEVLLQRLSTTSAEIEGIGRLIDALYKHSYSAASEHNPALCFDLSCQRCEAVLLPLPPIDEPPIDGGEHEQQGDDNNICPMCLSMYLDELTHAVQTGESKPQPVDWLLHERKVCSVCGLGCQ
jgi:hypothetical protein